MRTTLDAAAKQKDEWAVEKDSVKHYSVCYRRLELSKITDSSLTVLDLYYMVLTFFRWDAESIIAAYNVSEVRIYDNSSA